MTILPRDFYNRDTVQVARELLGKQLVRVMEDGTPLVCRITETEAYVGRMDKACHAYGYKRTTRTQTLFAPPVTSYVYLIYGMYHCLNFVTEPEGEPSAVLIRGVAPIENADRIAQYRFSCTIEQLTPYQRKNFLNGPGKLCKGLCLTREHNGLDLATSTSSLYVCDGPAPHCVHVGKRIGIDYAEEAVHFPWRFWSDQNP